jgi:hypothetical protein
VLLGRLDHPLVDDLLVVGLAFSFAPMLEEVVHHHLLQRPRQDDPVVFAHDFARRRGTGHC